MLKIKYILELETIVVIQDNKELLRIAYVIQRIVYTKKFLQLFILDLIMILLLS